MFRSNRGISAQLIDDDAGRTLAAVNWTEADLRELSPLEQAQKAGELLAQRASGRRRRHVSSSTAAAISTTVASRRLAEGAREGGLTL